MELATFLLFFPLFFLLPFLCTLSFAETMEFPKTRAEKMIRGLNLFPELDVNIAEEDPTFTAPKIVEKSLLFPCVGDPTCVQYLGHTAGYYRLPHAKSARYYLYLLFRFWELFLQFIRLGEQLRVQYRILYIITAKKNNIEHFWHAPTSESY